MNNAEWMIKQRKNFTDLVCHVNFVTDKFEICLDSKIMGEIGISTISKNPVLAWLDMEHEEPILDDTEKKYLSAVIKPFRDRVRYITKFLDTKTEEEYIAIDTGEEKYMSFPNFEENTMYKGMILRKWYTPEDLGL